MAKRAANDGAAKAAKAAANRRAYLAELERVDRVLLRLDKGLAERLDRARARLGLSRPAFLALRLPLIIGEDDAEPPPPDAIADEFDELFASGSP